MPGELGVGATSMMTVSSLAASSPKPDECDVEDEDGQPLFERARSKLGPLEPHEIYGFQPAIVLGGSFLLENLVKVKANVHLTLLRMFGEPTFPFSGIDIEEWLDESDTQ